MDWTTPLMNLIVGALIAVATSTLTVKLALKRFYSEKWWERKNAAYTAIIESLHHIREHADTNLTFALRGKDLPPDGDKSLTEKLQAAMADLRKHRDIGGFVVSEEALAALEQLFVELDNSTKTHHWQEHLELKLVAVDNCLPAMRRIARADLSLG